MKCRTVEELRTVKDGVTPDCYSYSNFIFRHLKKRDYTVGACIGSKVSRARQQDYEADAQRLKKELDEAKRMADGLKAVREMESLKEDPAYLESLSRAAQELEAVLLEKQEAEATIESLREGAYKELEEKEAELRKKRSELKKKMTGMQNEIAQQTGNQERIRTELQSKNAALKEAYVGYTEQPEITASVQEALSKRSSGSVKAQKNAEIEALGEKEQEQTEALSRARNAYILQYPSSGFSGSEKSNEGYEQLLAQYETCLLYTSPSPRDCS